MIKPKLLIVTGATAGLVLLGIGTYFGHELRVRHMVEQARLDGQAAFAEEDWKDACKFLGRYLSGRPDDVQVLPQYAQAQLAVRPLQPANMRAAITAYRRFLLVYSKGDEPTDEATLAKIYHELARLYQQTQDYGELAFIARQRLDEAPNDLQATLWFVKARLAQRKPAEAQAKLEALVKNIDQLEGNHHEYVEACILLSSIAAQDTSPGARDGGLKWLEQALKYDPDSVDVLLRRAALYRKLAGAALGDQREAMLAAAFADLEHAEGLEPNDPLQRLILSEAWLAKGRLDRAAAQWKAAKAANPAKVRDSFVNPADWIVAKFIVGAKLALLTRAKSDGVKLADETLGALTKSRQRIVVLPSAIRLYVAGDRVAKARQYLKEFLNEAELQQSTRQRDTQVAILKAIVAFAEGQPYAAIEALEPVAAHGESLSTTRRLLANAYVRTGQSSRAIRLLTEHVKDQPTDTASLTKLAREQLKQRNWAAAAETARRAERLRPDDPDIVLLRIQAELGSARQRPSEHEARLAAIEAELSALREAHPQRVDIRIRLAELAAQSGRYEIAEAELTRAIEQCSDKLPAVQQLVALYLQTERKSLAIDVCRRACREWATDVRPWHALARVFTVAGQLDEARAALVAGCDAVPDVDHKRVLHRELAVFDVLHGERASGIAALRRLAVDDSTDIATRGLLLNLPEVLASQEESEALIGEMKAVEGKTGLLWRVHQARLWLSSSDWRTRQREIEAMLKDCINAAPAWPVPALLLGKMHENVGRVADAERLYRRTLQRNAKATTIADRLLALLQRHGRFREALAVLQQIEQETAPGLWVDRSIALSVQAGDVESAIKQLQMRVAGETRDVNDLVMLARLTYLERKDAEQAFAYLDEAGLIAADSVDLTAARVFVLRQEGRTHESERVLDDYVSRKNDFESHLLRAAYYQWIGDLDRAEKGFAALQTLSRSSDGYFLLGKFYAQFDRLNEAIAVWDMGLAEYPGDLRLMLGLAKALVAQRAESKDHQRAETLLTQLTQRLPDNAEVTFLRAALKVSAGNGKASDQAIALLEQAIELDPGFVAPYVRLIPIRLNRGEYSAARDLAVRALAISPTNKRLQTARAVVELAGGDLDLAKDLAIRVLRTQPNDRVAIGILVDVALQTHNLDLLLAIRETVSRGLELSPYTETLQIAQTLILVAEGKLDDAVRQYPPGVLETVAAALAGSASPPHVRAARTLYRAVLKKQPVNLQALNNLAWILVTTYSDDDGLMEEALQLADEALRQDPQSAHVRDTRGVVLSKLPGRLSEARAEFEKCLELTDTETPAYARTLLQLARVCYRLNDHETVTRLLKDATRLDRKHGAFSEVERSEIERMLATANTR